MKQVPHVSFILPAQISGNPFDDLEGHLWFLHLAPGLEVEHEFEEIEDQVDVEDILSEDSVVQKWFEALERSW